MKANKDPEIQIKEIDRDLYHVEHTRIMQDSTRKHPTKNKRIQCYDRKDYEKMFGKNRSPHAGLGAMNDDEVRVVHDPVYQKQLDDEAIAKAEKARLAREKADKAKAEKEAKEKRAADTKAKKEAEAAAEKKKAESK